MRKCAISTKKLVISCANQKNKRFLQSCQIFIKFTKRFYKSAKLLYSISFQVFQAFRLSEPRFLCYSNGSQAMRLHHTREPTDLFCQGNTQSNADVQFFLLSSISSSLVSSSSLQQTTCCGLSLLSVLFSSGPAILIFSSSIAPHSFRYSNLISSRSPLGTHSSLWPVKQVE